MKTVKDKTKCSECNGQMIDIYSQHFYIDEDNGDFERWGEEMFYEYSECLECGEVNDGQIYN